MLKGESRVTEKGMLGLVGEVNERDRQMMSKMRIKKSIKTDIIIGFQKVQNRAQQLKKSWANKLYEESVKIYCFPNRRQP